MLLIPTTIINLFSIKVDNGRNYRLFEGGVIVNPTEPGAS